MLAAVGGHAHLHDRSQHRCLSPPPARGNEPLMFRPRITTHAGSWRRPNFGAVILETRTYQLKTPLVEIGVGCRVLSQKGPWLSERLGWSVILPLPAA